MRKEPITFNNLPQAVNYLTEQVEKIYQLLMTMQQQKVNPQHQLIDIDKACQIVQKAKPTIYRLARTGLIPVYKRGKKLYFYEDELLKWIETGKKTK
jgi:excisionase family DNA binding protein